MMWQVEESPIANLSPLSLFLLNISSALPTHSSLPHPEQKEQMERKRKGTSREEELKSEVEP